MKVAIQTQAVDLMIGDGYFKLFPGNILGTPFETTGKYGQKEIVVKGTLEAAMLQIKLPKPSQYPWHSYNPEKWAKDEQVETDNAIDKVIQLTESFTQAPDTSDLELLSFQEIRERYNPKATDLDYTIWVNYQLHELRETGLFKFTTIARIDNGWGKFILPIGTYRKKRDEWVKSGEMAFDGSMYYPAFIFYSGNLLERKEKMKRREGTIVLEYGQGVFESQMNRLQSRIPAKLTIMASDNEALFLSPLDPLCNKFEIDELSDGTFWDKPRHLVYAFETWLLEQPQDRYKAGSGYHDIANHFLSRERFENNTSPEEKARRTNNAKVDGMALFRAFLKEGLTREDQQHLEHIWNSEFNNWNDPEYQDMPVGLQINKYFKKGPMEPRKALWEGVKFLSVHGTGLIAYDVGVGKTMTAILAVGQALYTGQCKRPLIVVPNPTYDKWIGETIGVFNDDGSVKAHGVLPQYKNKIRGYGNLRQEYIKYALDNPPEDGTITFCTFSALEIMGFSKEIYQQFAVKIFEILNQGIDKRERAAMWEKIDKMLGDATAKAMLNVDEMGFDYVVIDEAHNFNKLFPGVKSREEDGERGDKNYNLTSAQSTRAIKAFLITQHILEQNHLRNVCLLTATPFTNSPLEIYSMLAMCAYKGIAERGLVNVVDFFDKFIIEESVEAVTGTGEVRSMTVVKRFQNRIILQSIIYNFIIYKTGEEANVPRPNKIVYPYTKTYDGKRLPYSDQIDTALKPTPVQKEWLAKIQEMSQGEGELAAALPARYFEDDSIKAPVLLAITMAQACTLSPHLLKVYESDKGKDPVYLYGNGNPTHNEYVDGSPKLKYTMECIRSVKAWHDSRNEPVSGVVLFMNRGVDYFPLLKQYLIHEIGYTPKQVEIIASGMKPEKKEAIKKDFLEGTVKVIIGSTTIKEGIDLQDKSTCLFICDLPWNPTDIKQVEGRIYRQGNQHQFVRIVTPLIENSIDPFLYQKLEEKTSRVNDIWYRAGRGNVLDVDDLDINDLKVGLLTDPKSKVEAEIRNAVDKIKIDVKIVEDYIIELTGAQKRLEEFNTGQIEMDRLYGKAIPWLERRVMELVRDVEDEPPSKQAAIYKRIDRFRGMLQVGDKDEKNINNVVKQWAAHTGNYRYIKNVDKYIKARKVLDQLQKNILDKNGLTIADDLQPLIDQYNQELEKFHNQIKALESPENKRKLIAKAEKEREEKSKLSKTLPERVEQWTEHNHLLSCIKDEVVCDPDDRADDKPGNYYVTAVDHGKTNVYPLLGPFKDDHARALQYVDVVEKLAREDKSGKGVWASYGTTRFEYEYDKPGSANAHFPEAFKPVIKIEPAKPEITIDKLKLLKLKAIALKLKYKYAA